MSAKAAATGLSARRCLRCGTPLQEEARGCPRCGAPEAWTPESTRRIDPVRGLFATLKGLRFVGQNPRLWTWIALPMALNLILFIGLVWWLAGSLSGFMPDFSEPWPGWIDWLRAGLDALGFSTLLSFLAGLVGTLAAFFLTLLLSGIVNAPFYDVLSERTESAFFGQQDPGRGLGALPADTLRALGAALSLAMRQLIVLGVLFLLSFFVVGAPFFAAAGFYFAGLALVDVTLSRKLYRGRVRAHWSRRHLLTVLALGVPVSLVPPLAPFGIVGATLLFLEDPDKP